MSHVATNWAFTQRGLKPATKLVLLVLADCHNPAYGCFPSQAFLAHECEMSRAGVNVHLDHLEQLGLIIRVRTFDAETKRRKSTRYRLAFEADFKDENATEAGADDPEKAMSRIQTRPPKAMSRKQQKPCPDFTQSHVQNLDTNLVSEPLREPCVGDAAKDLEIEGFEEFWKACPRPRNRARCAQLLADALEDGVRLEVVVQAMQRYRADNAGNQPMYLAYADNWLAEKRWQDYPKAAPQPATGDVIHDAAAFWADKVKRGSYVPSSAISIPIANFMVKSGMVSADELAKLGIAR